MAFDREKTLHLAQKYVDKRKYDRAIGEYQRVVQQDPNDARTLLRLGDLQSRIQSYSDAIASYDRVARFYASRGFSLKAVAVLKQIREMIDSHAPQLADQYSHVSPKLAHIYAEMGLVSDALATYEGVVRRLHGAGRERDVVEILRKMLDLDQGNPLPYLRLAEALCRVGRLDEAIEYFWTAAQQLTALDRKEDALKVIERILHFRQDVRVCRVAAELYLARGTREAALLALARLQACFDADPKDLETLLLLAVAFELLGQSSKSVEVYKEMVRQAAAAGQVELRDKYLAHLQVVAPGDEEVQALARVEEAGSSSQAKGSIRSSPDGKHGPALKSAPPESLPFDDIEYLDDVEEVGGGEEARVEEPETAVTASWSERQRSRVQPPPFAVTAETEVEQGAEQSVAGPGPGEPRDGEELARQALVDAESFRGLGLHDRAIKTLRGALDQRLSPLEMRAALARVLQESGDFEGAAAENVEVAKLHLQAGATQMARAHLQAAVAANSGNTDAQQLLEQLGAAAEAVRPAGEHEAFELRPRVVPPTSAPDNGRPPLPSYTLEYDELDADEVASVPPESADAPDSEMSAAVTQVPPPRRGNAASSGAVTAPPLPQFTLEGLHVSPAPPSVIGSGPPSSGGMPIPLSRPAAARVSAGPPSRGVLPAPAVEDILPSSPPPVRPSEAPPRLSDRADSVPSARRLSIRAALDEVDFFTSRGLYQDAAMILRERLEQYPGEPGLVEALQGLDGHLQSSGAGGLGEQVFAAPAPGEAGMFEAPASSVLGGARFTTGVDNATEEVLNVLELDDDIELVASLDRAPAKEVDVDEVFAKFKQGVKEQIEDSDSATHYDLGLAYKEMGLLDDAGREFEIASRDPKRECNSLAMMGMMYRETGDLDRAAEAYVRGLNSGHKTASQELSIFYELGCIYQDKRDFDEARYYFERVARRDGGYRDVARYLEAIAAMNCADSVAPRANGS